jgi:hypothetical protein
LGLKINKEELEIAAQIPDARGPLLNLRLEVAPEAVLGGPDPETVNDPRPTSLIHESDPSSNTSEGYGLREKTFMPNIVASQ